MVGSVGLRPGRLCCPRVHCASSVGGTTREPLVLRRNCRRRRRARTALVASDVGRRPGRLCCPRVRRASPSGRRDAGAPECTAQSPSMQTHPDRPCRQRCRSAARASMLPPRASRNPQWAARRGGTGIYGAVSVDKGRWRRADSARRQRRVGAARWRGRRLAAQRHLPSP